VELLTWMPGTGRLLVAGGDEVTVWWAGLEVDADDGSPASGPPRRALDGGRITALAPHPLRRRVAVGTDDGTVGVWDLASDRYIPLGWGSDPVTALCWDALGERMFVGTRAGGAWAALAEEDR
jgi:hypothetical protein